MAILNKTISRVSEEFNTQKISGMWLDFIKRRKFFVIGFVLIVIVSYGVYAKFFHLTDAERAQKELSKAVAAVSELMILPEGDEPVLATVTDAASLIKQQAFFAGSVNGDQLLLFPKNMKAVIYSPSRGKIINAGPIEKQTQAVAPQDKGEIAAPRTSDVGARNDNSAVAVIHDNNLSDKLKVAFYNGTKTVGLANEIESKLKMVFPNFETSAKTNTAKKDYRETIVVDLSGGEKSAGAKNIASALGAKVGALPDGEARPDADILIIVGEK